MMEWTLWRDRSPPKWKRRLHRAGARNVEAPAIRDNFAPPLERKTLDDGNALGYTGTLAVSRSPQEDVPSRNLGREGTVAHQ
jgi:hypothetical protein